MSKQRDIRQFQEQQAHAEHEKNRKERAKQYVFLQGWNERGIGGTSTPRQRWIRNNK